MMTDTNRLSHSSPEAQGIRSSAILTFIQEAEQRTPEINSLMLLRHGQVVAEGWWIPYGPQIPHMLFSLSKSYTSTAVGFAVAEGRLSVDDTVLSFFPDEVPAEVSANLAAMKVRHLLSMSTGHAEDTTGFLHEDPDGNWVKAFLARPVEYEPGTHFLYNSGATYMCSAIVQKLTGMRVVDYLEPRLFAPLGIEGATWETCPRGIDAGGWGLSIKTEDIARFGQFCLQKGTWQGRQLLPTAWIEQATSKQVPNDSQSNIDWKQGYGYQFWRCRHGAYRGDGAFGQYCIVMPEQEAVLAITSGVKDMQAVLDLVWEHLLSAMGSGPLPEDGAAQAELAHKLANLSLSVPAGEGDSPLATGLSGKTFRFAPNEAGAESLALDFSQGCTLILGNAAGKHRIQVGIGRWLIGETTFDIFPSHPAAPQPAAAHPVATSGAWSSADTLVAKLCYYETPFSLTMTMRFAESEMTLQAETNVSFGPTKNEALHGKAD